MVDATSMLEALLNARLIDESEAHELISYGEEEIRALYQRELGETV